MYQTEFLVYILHWIFVIGSITFSWFHSRNFLHPHFIFTIIICIFLSDFLIRGYEDKNLVYIDKDNIYKYQIIILLIFSITVFITSFIGNKKIKKNLTSTNTNIRVTKKTLRIILIISWSILFIEFYKRFSSVNWSSALVIEQSLLARGEASWELASYSGNFIYTFIRMVLPFSGIAFAFLIANSKGIKRISASIGFIIIVLVLVGNGSRTPVVMSLGVLWIFIIIKTQSTFVRLSVSAAVLASTATLTSVIYLFRSYGYSSEALADSGRSFELKYHQDDSYYRTIFSYNYSDLTGESWDGLFYIYAILANPIPRALWPSKPLIDEEFYGGFKVWYTTHLYLGEIVSIVGVEWSILVGILMGIIFYNILYKSTAILKYPMGLGSYLLMALYVYMCMRGMQNIMIFAYLPIFAVIVTILIGRLQRKSNKPPQFFSLRVKN